MRKEGSCKKKKCDWSHRRSIVKAQKKADKKADKKSSKKSKK